MGEDQGGISGTEQPLAGSGDPFNAPLGSPAPTPAPKAPKTPKAPKKRSQRDKLRVPLRNAAIFVVTAAIAVALLYSRHQTTAPINASPAGTGQPWVDSASPSASPSAPSSTSPSPSPSQSFANPDYQYFSDSPSLTWADNVGGIVSPKTAKLGSFSASQVAAGYASMRKLLTAGNLDATILDGGSVADFSDLLDPLSKVPAKLKAWVKSPSAKTDPTNLVTRFDPATTRLLGHIVKVEGSMAAALDKNRDLLITGDYKFVYAVGPAKGIGSPSRTVVHRTYQVWVGRPGKYEVTSGKIWLEQYSYEIANLTCFQYNGFIDPTFGNDSGADSGKTIDPYASANPSASASVSPSTAASPECDTVSRL